MDKFLSRFQEEHNTGRTPACEETKWLQNFYCDVVKYVYREELSDNAEDICCAVLNQVKKCRTRVNGWDEASYAWLPLKHTIAPLVKFIHSVKRVLTGYINDDNDDLSEDLSQVELAKETGFKSSQTAPYLLLGYLTHMPSKTKPEQDAGTLYLEDNTAAIPCELITPDKKYLGQLVVIPEYNYVPGPHCFSSSSQKEKECEWKRMGYLEISGKCEPVLEPEEVMHSFPVALSLDQFLRQDRSKKTSVYGKITALSPVHCIRNSKPFFLIRLTSQETNISISVVVQGSYHMYWHNFLCIEEVFVFTDVLETTMNKGTKNERRVVASTKSSDFFRRTEQVFVNETRGQKRSLHEEGLDTTNKIAVKRSKTEAASCSAQIELDSEQSDALQVMTATSRQPLSLSYSGVVTKCIKSEAGLYELDGKYRLFLNHQPSVNMARGLRVGSRITLLNVHLCKKDKKILGLCCCTRSAVKIDTFSSLASPWKPCKSSESPLFLLGQDLTISEYVDLVLICDQLLKMFFPLFRTRQLIAYSTESQRKNHPSKRSVVERLLEEAKSKVDTTTRNTRNIYGEFFDEPHNCHPTRPSVISLHRILSMMEFLEIVQSKTAHRPWMTGNAGNPESDTPTEWCYQVFQHQEIDPVVSLLGCLRGSSSTGQLQLYDQTGAVDCVITSADDHVVSHCCLTDCCNKSMLTSPSGAANGAEGRSHCPFAHFWHYDVLIKLDEFQVVVEHFKVEPTLRDTNTLTVSGDKNSVLRIYFQFSLEDAQILAHRQKAFPGDTVDTVNKESSARLEVGAEGDGRRCRKFGVSSQAHNNEAVNTMRAAEEYNRGRDQLVTVVGSSERREEHLVGTSGGESGERALAVQAQDKAVDGEESVAHARAIQGKNLGSEARQIVHCVFFLVRHTEDPTLRKCGENLSYTSGVDIKIVGWSSSSETKSLSKERTSLNKERSELQSCASEDILGKCQENCTDVECNHLWGCLADFKLQAKSSVLKIATGSIHWLRLLHPGCLYILRERSPDEESSRILKVMKGRGKQVIEVKPEMDFERICSCDACLTPYLPRDSIDDLLRGSESGSDTSRETLREQVYQAIDAVKQRFVKDDVLMTVEEVLTTSDQSRDSTQLGFRALVVSRELRLSEIPGQRLPNEFLEIPKFGPVKKAKLRGLGLGFCYLGNKTIHLKVRDIDSMNVLGVYVDLSRTACICGVLPGAVIQCRRFIRKFSRSGNIYCIYDACSSIVVEQRAPPNISGNSDKFAVASHSGEHGRFLETRINTDERKNAQVPNRYLIELIRSESEGVLIQTICRVRCRVVAVQRATMRWKCSRCGELVMREECTGTCTSAKDSRFRAEARCVIEDGTGEAQLYLYDDVIPALLQLSAQQWSQLRDMSMETGELLYQRAWHGADNPLKTSSGPFSKATEAKLTWARYCCSPSLPRLVAVYCKHFRVNKRETASARTDAGFESRSVTIGATEHSTLVLPRLMLKAVDFMEARATQDARVLLDLLQHTSP